MRKLLLGAAMAAVLVPVTSLAQETMEDWARTAVVAGNDEQIGWTDQGVSLIRAGSQRSLGNGHVEIRTRFEFQSAQTDNGFRYRSLATTYDFDCASHSERATARTGYQANNLGGASQAVPAEDDWATFGADTVLETLYQRVCGGGGASNQGGGGGK